MRRRCAGFAGLLRLRARVRRRWDAGDARSPRALGAQNQAAGGGWRPASGGGAARVATTGAGGGGAGALGVWGEGDGGNGSGGAWAEV